MPLFTFELTAEQFEAIRDQFFKVTNIDLHNLDYAEVRNLLELLPRALTAIHHRYDLPIIYAEDDEDKDE